MTGWTDLGYSVAGYYGAQWWSNDKSALIIGRRNQVWWILDDNEVLEDGAVYTPVSGPFDTLDGARVAYMLLAPHVTYPKPKP